MTARSDAERKATERRRYAESGLKRVEVYCRPEDEAAVRAYDRRPKKAPRRRKVDHPVKMN